jgi:hypothetical protein
MAAMNKMFGVTNKSRAAGEVTKKREKDALGASAVLRTLWFGGEYRT